MRVSENMSQHGILHAASTLQGWSHIHRAVAESIPDVMENRDKSKLTALEENPTPFPCNAEDGDDDNDVDDDDDDDVFSTLLHAGPHLFKFRMSGNKRNVRNKRIARTKRIELKHEVSIEQSCRACHLQTTDMM